MSAPKDKPIPLDGLTAAHKFLVDLTLYEEKDGEMYDSHLEYLSEIFYNHLSTEQEVEAMNCLEKLKEFIDIAMSDIQMQAKQHLINHNKEVSETNFSNWMSVKPKK
jgi:hypothetical protein